MVLLQLLGIQLYLDIFLAAAADIDTGHGGQLFKFRDDLIIHVVVEVPCLWVVHRQVDAGRIIDVKFHDVRRLGILREVPLEGIQLFL